VFRVTGPIRVFLVSLSFFAWVNTHAQNCASLLGELSKIESEAASLELVFDPNAGDLSLWEAFFAQNGGTNPVEAFNSGMKVPLTRSQILNPPVEVLGLFGMNEAPAAEGSRSGRILRNLEELATKQRADEFLIFFAGADHAFDFFFETSANKGHRSPGEIGYLAPSIDETTTSYENVKKLYLRLKTEKSRRVSAGENIDHLSLALELFETKFDRYIEERSRGTLEGIANAFLLRMALRKKFAREKYDLLTNQITGPPPNYDPQPTLMFVMDFHGTNGGSYVSGLPDPIYFKKRGIKKVTLASEGMEVGQFKFKDFGELSDLRVDITAHWGAQAIAKLKAEDLPLWKLMFEEPTGIHPNIREIEKRLQEYQNAGLEVEIRGMESK